MLVFDEGCIRSDIWMKGHEKKRGENTHSGHFRVIWIGTP